MIIILIERLKLNIYAEMTYIHSKKLQKKTYQAYRIREIFACLLCSADTSLFILWMKLLDGLIND